MNFYDEINNTNFTVKKGVHIKGVLGGYDTSGGGGGASPNLPLHNTPNFKIC